MAELSEHILIGRFRLATSPLNKTSTVPSFLKPAYRKPFVPPLHSPKPLLHPVVDPKSESDINGTVDTPARGYTRGRTTISDIEAGAEEEDLPPLPAVSRPSPFVAPRVDPVASSSRTKAVAERDFYKPKLQGDKIVIGEKNKKERLEWGGAIFNPHAEGAVVMKRIPEKWAKLK